MTGFDFRRPDARRLGLGIGLDLAWGSPVGIEFVPGRGDALAERVVRFLWGQTPGIWYFFFSFQPRGRARLDYRDYIRVFDDAFARIPQLRYRGLHQTTFNLGALEPYDRDPSIDFTNAFIERYGFRWVNEDLGLWSIHGRPLPYPLPPYLTDEGLKAAIRNTDYVQRRLKVPLVVEFPGFSDGTSFCIGDHNAYEFFTRVVKETGSPATLDVGHLLSYRWLLGHRGEALYGDLDRLPLYNCFEIHLSGCAIEGDRFLDYHHGILLDEQLELLRRLIPRCPNLVGVTYEDPRFDAEGVLLPETRASYDNLRKIVQKWG